MRCPLGRLVPLLVLLACGHDRATAAKAARTPEGPAASAGNLGDGSAAESSAGSGSAAAGRRLRLDRPPRWLGGPLSWAAGANEVAAMRFCPGDQELVALDYTGQLYRYRVDTGAQLAVTHVGRPPGGLLNMSDDRPYLIDCRADGVALVLDGQGSPVLVDARGATTAPPRPIRTDGNPNSNRGAMFADDGSVLVLAGDRVMRWRGPTVEIAIQPREHVDARWLAEGGAYIERVSRSGKARADGLWLTRSGTRLRLPNPPRESSEKYLSVAPDGAVAVGEEMRAYGWPMTGKVVGKPVQLYTSDYRVHGVVATDRWLIAIWGTGELTLVERPAMRDKRIEPPCDDLDMQSAMAVSRDDTRIAVACPSTGIRVIDLTTGKQISKDRVASGAFEVAWSPSGDRLAAHGMGVGLSSNLRIWRGDELIRAFELQGETGGLWWQSADVIGGAVSSWTVADGAQHSPAWEIQTDVAARSPHGEIVVVGSSSGAVVLRGDQATRVALPPTTHDRIRGIAIDDAGTHAVVWRGDNYRKPAQEIVEIDLRAGTAKATALAVTAAAVGDDGAVVIGSPDGEVVLRRDGQATALGKLAGGVTALAISHGVILAGGHDGTLQLWSRDGAALGKLTGHTAPVRALAFAPDGVHLASAGDDATLTWDLAP